MTDQPTQAIRKEFLFPCIIGLLFVCNFFAFYPGLISNDVITQLEQAISGEYSDYHPPIMSWVWRQLIIYFEDANQYGLMLTFHVTLYWCAIYIFSRTLAKGSVLVVVLFGSMWLVPPVMAMTGALWKDTGMACSWLLACALMTESLYKKRPPGIVSSLVIVLCLFYGTAVRHNAVTALPPLCYWFARCFRQDHWKWQRTATVAILLFLGLCMAKATFHAHTVQQNARIEQLLLAQDTKIILRFVDKPFPEPLKKWPLAAEDEAAVFSAYLKMLMNNPYEYLYYRWIAFKFVMRIGYPKNCVPYAEHWANDTESTPRAISEYYLTFSGKSFWFKPYVWIALSFVLFVIGIRSKPPRRESGPVVMLLNASSLMYSLPYFIIATSCDFRYFYWCVISTLCSLAIVVAEEDNLALAQQKAPQ